MKIAVLQLNLKVGDVSGNTDKIANKLASISKQGVDVLVCSECCLTGYPTQDLVLYDSFITVVEQQLERLCRYSEQFPTTAICVGAPRKENNKLYNSAYIIQAGNIKLIQDKIHLPNTDVFDEKRYFSSGESQSVIEIAGKRLGLAICEDAWTYDATGTPLYSHDPIEQLAQKQVDLMVVLSASPFELGKKELRQSLFLAHAKRHHVPVVVVNQVGGNDQLIFDGNSFVLNEEGSCIHTLAGFKEDEYVFCLDDVNKTQESAVAPDNKNKDIKDIHDALVLGIRDYVTKTGFKSVILGLSGGIDSAVVAALAVEALGSTQVNGVLMPSQYSSAGSLADAKDLVKKLNINHQVIPIQDSFNQLYKDVSQKWQNVEQDETEENMQSRIRGLLLMACSNKWGHLVLNTGNKSELAMGYCTLYGDMNGALSVLADVPKTWVYKLAHYINRDEERIPKNSIEKPPSAELRPNQTDADTLPPYDFLDDVLCRYIDKQESSDRIKKDVGNADQVDWIIKKVNQNEYKRQQAPPPLRVSSKSFGVGRRLPLAADYPI